MVQFRKVVPKCRRLGMLIEFYFYDMRKLFPGIRSVYERYGTKHRLCNLFPIGFEAFWLECVFQFQHFLRFMAENIEFLEERYKRTELISERRPGLYVCFWNLNEWRAIMQCELFKFASGCHSNKWQLPFSRLLIRRKRFLRITGIGDSDNKRFPYAFFSFKFWKMIIAVYQHLKLGYTQILMP